MLLPSNFIPEGSEIIIRKNLIDLAIKYYDTAFYLFRFNAVPESGETKGLLLALDAHSNLVTSSSVTEAYRARTTKIFIFIFFHHR